MFYQMCAVISALTLTLLTGSPALALGDSTHDGKVVSITNEQLVMADRDGKEHNHALNADAKVCLDGKICKIDNLKAGMRIRVTIKDDAKNVAVRIEALENNKEFSSTQDGKVVSVNGDKLVMTCKDGKEITCTLTGDATVTLDGKGCRIDDLKAGTRIRVTTPGDGKQQTSNVEAIVNNDDFERRG